MNRESTNPQNLKRPFDKTVFVEYSSNKPGQHFITVIKTVDGKRRIIGRIFREYDKENKKASYVARDWSGTQVFQDIPDLPSIKKNFIEHGKTFAMTLPVNPNHEQEKELDEDTQREIELKEIRERKADKEQERGIEKII